MVDFKHRQYRSHHCLYKYKKTVCDLSICLKISTTNTLIFSSSVIQQKVVSLNTIANLLSLQSTGIYEDIIEIPIEQIFFVVRLCLDENTPSVLIASLKAMRNLFYNQIDETCLDALLGFGGFDVQPILAIDEEEDDETVNDQQLAETNLVKCLARTNVLVRIR